MLVSVIIPTYNGLKTIERAVNSVLGQSWKPLEVIVVDDGSTDRTADILEGYGNRIRLIRQKNQGPSVARNVGIKAARGEIISLLDHDDEWLSSKIERQVKLLQATESLGVKCCVCNARMEFTTGTRTSFGAADLRPKYPEGVWTNPAEILIDRFLLFNQVVAVRREALEQTGYFRQDLPFGLNEEYDLALRLSLLGPWAFIADPLVVWREHESNLYRAHRPRDICLTTLQILKDLCRSSQFGPLLPEGLLRRRIQFLERGVAAWRLSEQPNPVVKLAGKCLLRYLWVRGRLYWWLPSTPRMMTRAV
jgi:glycosyltransferase involved in cell wall biosynthesis